MTQYSHDTLMALAGAYALGATTPEESTAIEAAMATSPALAAEVMAHQQTVTELVLGQPGVPPSPSVRGRLLELTSTSSAHVTAPVRRRSFVPFAAAASLLLIVGAGIVMFRLQRELGVLRTSEQQVATNLEHRETTLNSLLHAEKDLHVVHLRAADTVVGPGIQLFWDARHQTGIVHAFRLPPAPTGHSYQLWAVVNNQPVSVRVFDSEPDGHVLVEGVMMPALTRSVSKMMVTIEPRGGSLIPTSVPLLGSTTLSSE